MKTLNQAGGSVWRRRGISLLEVLIAIGILSVGLLSMLSLLPAGRSYLVKAELDDRTAAIVPNAISTMEALGLFAEDSLEWRVVYEPALSAPPLDDQEEPAHRPQWFTLPWEQRSNDASKTASITDRYPSDGEVDMTLSGTIPIGAATTVEILQAGEAPEFAAVDEAGNWLFTKKYPPSAKQAEIIQEGDKAGSLTGADPSDKYRFSATYLDESQNPPAVEPADFTLTVESSPPAEFPDHQKQADGFTLYGARRRADQVRGKAKINLTVAGGSGGSAPDATNNTPDTARLISAPDLEDDAYRVGEISKLRMVRDVRVRFAGELWRFETGTALVDEYIDRRTFSTAHNGTPQSNNVEWPTWSQPDQNPGAYQPTGADSSYWQGWATPEDEDYIRVPVRKGYGVTMRWQGTGANSQLLEPDVFGYLDRRRNLPLFPLEFQGSGNWLPLDPYAAPPAGTYASYSVPNDGFIRTGVALADEYPTGHSRVGQPIVNTVSYPAGSSPQNVEYALDIDIFRADRMIAIDPLMASHLDRAVGGANPGRHPLANRRRYFAEFEQQYSAEPDDPRTFVIPRLNWKFIADNPNFDAAVAVAERICRADDSLATLDPEEQGDPPTPNFVLDRNDRPLRREYDGRLTWMLTIQPEAAGPVAANWYAGNMFESSIVIFEDRTFPLAGDKVFEGEYAFEAGWSDVDGMLHVHVPRQPAGAPPLADDDVKRLFSPGSWLLLGPRVAVTSAPVDESMKLQWIRILSSEFQPRQGEVVARILLEREPKAEVLIRPRNPPGPSDSLRFDDEGRLRVMAMVYKGVVAVVTRSMPVREAR